MGIKDYGFYVKPMREHTSYKTETAPPEISIDVNETIDKITKSVITIICVYAAADVARHILKRWFV